MSSLSADLNPLSYFGAVAAVSILKILLLNSYRSTDFEVHRNWLAITHSLPLEKWYYEETSEWTLDYPPFFAYFEWGLSQAAKYFDEGMLKVNNLNYASASTIIFQKLSVVCVDLLLAYSVLRCTKCWNVLFPVERVKNNPLSPGILFILIFVNGGLFLVDQIHFQYNGFLFGILLLSIATSLEGKLYQSAAIFAALVNFKHIFLYVAPAFGVYFLRKKCFPPSAPLRLVNVVSSIACFGVVGVSVLTASFGPFYQHIPQILKRLFPFQRGLSHAYWAPNIWAAYNTLDWILNMALKKGKSTVTTGLVGETTLSVLPQVLPIHTFILTLTFMMPALYKIWKSPTKLNFVQGVIATGWTSFMFGYHVHEKAILNVVIPFSLLSFHQPNLYFITLVTGTVSLFPLLFTPFEIVLKAIIALLHLTLTVQVIPLKKFKSFEIVYMFGFIVVYFCENLGPVLFPRFPFLPLILVSDYCFIGILYCYGSFYYQFVSSLSESNGKQKSSPAKSPRQVDSIKVPLVPTTIIPKYSPKLLLSSDDDVVEEKVKVKPRRPSSKKTSPSETPSTRVLRSRNK